MGIASRPSTESVSTGRSSDLFRKALWFALAAACTAGLWSVRASLDKAHMALVYLLLVLFTSSQAGRSTGLLMAFVCFLSFNFFLLPPYHTFRLENSLDWLVLASFLITGAVAAELLARNRRLTIQTQRVEALREADRLKDELLAAVSHDLRTPLTTIKALAADVKAGGDERALIIEEEADRLNELVGNLLDLSRIRAGGIPVNPELIAADDLLGAVLGRFAGEARMDRIETHLESSELLVGRFDFVHSLRVLANVIENALKYSPADSIVELSVRRRGPNLLFSVSDRGPGIADSNADRIFEAFYHEPRDQRRTEGVGLGLAIARDLARAQGGDVVYERRPGGGSTFIVSLPSADLSATAFANS